MVSRFLWNKWGMLIIGVVLLAVGIASSGGEVMCDGKPMAQDQTCGHFRKRRAVINTYAEEKFHQNLTSYLFTGGGTVFLTAGVVWFIVDRRRTSTSQSR